VNHRGAWQFEDYARAALESLPENSILVTKLWDVTVAPFYYLQGCEGLRKDVDVVDYSLLHDRYWYPEQMRAQSPELAKALGKPLEEWEKAVADFDLRGKANPLVLTPRFDAVYNGILAQMSKRPVYFGPDVYADIMEGKYPMPPKDVIPVPEAYFVRLKLADSAQDYAPIPDSTALIRYGGQTDAYETKLLKEQLRIIWRLRSVYEQNFGFPERAAAIQGRLQALDAR
jgi:hypothetical protein